MSFESLGTGLRFPIELNGQGAIAVSADADKVAESIRIILGTAKGERVMRPDFGCDINSFLFATIDTSTCTMMETAVRDALLRWEPRIELRRVRVSMERASDGVLLIGIDYPLRRTMNDFNLVYPFNIRAGA